MPPPSFELRFHQDNHLPSLSRADNRKRSSHHGRKNQRRRNKRHIHHDEIGSFVHALATDDLARYGLASDDLSGRIAGQITSVGFLQQANPWVLANLEVHLTVA